MRQARVMSPPLAVGVLEAYYRRKPAVIKVKCQGEESRFYELFVLSCSSYGRYRAWSKKIKGSGVLHNFRGKDVAVTFIMRPRNSVVYFE